MGQGHYIKHMAFAVRDAQAAWQHYKDFIGVGHDGVLADWPGSRITVAKFEVGGVEYQLSQSWDEGGRFDAWINERGHEGLHHICYAVPDIDAVLAEAQARGATLKECSVCKVKGSHAHPEGWVAFLEEETGGVELELMQVYTAEQLAEYQGAQDI